MPRSIPIALVYWVTAKVVWWRPWLRQRIPMRCTASSHSRVPGWVVKKYWSSRARKSAKQKERVKKTHRWMLISCVGCVRWLPNPRTLQKLRQASAIGSLRTVRMITMTPPSKGRIYLNNTINSSIPIGCVFSLPMIRKSIGKKYNVQLWSWMEIWIGKSMRKSIPKPSLKPWAHVASKMMWSSCPITIIFFNIQRRARSASTRSWRKALVRKAWRRL